jgi:hypothetical protein
LPGAGQSPHSIVIDLLLNGKYGIIHLRRLKKKGRKAMWLKLFNDNYNYPRMTIRNAH